MNELLRFPLLIALTASILIAAKVLLGKRISPKAHFFLWVILLVQLLTPILPPLPQSSVSLQNSLTHTAPLSRMQLPQTPLVFTPAPQSQPDGLKMQTLRNAEPLRWQTAVPFVYRVGVVVSALFFLASYLLFCHKARGYRDITNSIIINLLYRIKKQLHINRDVKIKSGGDSPLLKGILRPEILLPEGYSEKETESILLHELLHLKHHDVFLSILSTVLLCFYWFHPMVWLCFFLFRRDMERLCDYRVLLLTDDRKAYADALLKTAMKRSHLLPGTTSMQNGTHEISKRIRAIAAFRKPNILWGAAAILAGLIIAVLCLTSASKTSSAITQDSLNAQTLYSFKTSYVGNASKVSGLLGNLHFSQYKNGIALQTKKTPYGITANYKGLEPQADKTLFTQNAAVIFSLVDNVDYVIFKAGDTPLIFYRSGFEQAFGKDLREYSRDLDTFSTEFLPKLSSLNTGTLTNGVAETLPPFFYQSDDAMEQLAYDAISTVYGRQTSHYIPAHSTTIFSAEIFKVQQQEDRTSIYLTFFADSYIKEGTTIAEQGGSILPAKLIFLKNADDSYTLKEFITAKDGSYWAPSIRDYCKSVPGLADKIISYNDHSKLSRQNREHLLSYLKDNGIDWLSIKSLSGETQK